MAKQDRWPRGTPVAPSGRGPGGGRFRGRSPDWSGWDDGDDPLLSIDRGSFAVDATWIHKLLARIDDRPFKPGAWLEVSPSEYMATVWERVAEGLFDDGMSESAAAREATQMLHEIKRPRKVLRNGPHEVVVETWEPLPEADLMAHLDRLLAQYPPGGHPVRLSIAPTYAIRGGLTLRTDESEQSPAIIMLSDEIFEGRFSDGPAMMPVGQNVPVWQYVLTHEWGHVTTLGSDAKRLHKKQREHLSEYGRSNLHEGAAEAFAEWVLSGGQTENRAAQAYREHYGWKVPQ